MKTLSQVLEECANADWFMIIHNGKHDLFLEEQNKQDIIDKYGDAIVKSYSGIGSAASEAQSVKIELAGKGEWVFVKKYGETYVAPVGYPWWVFEYRKANEKHPDYWIFMPELNIWRRNVSAC